MAMEHGLFHYPLSTNTPYISTEKQLWICCYDSFFIIFRITFKCSITAGFSLRLGYTGYISFHSSSVFTVTWPNSYSNLVQIYNSGKIKLCNFSLEENNLRRLPGGYRGYLLRLLALRNNGIVHFLNSVLLCWALHLPLQRSQQHHML